MSARTEPGPPLWLLAELTYRCPLHCVYCSNPVDYTKYGQELSTDDWLRVLREARDLGATQLGFSGGEPLDDVRKYAAVGLRILRNVDDLDMEPGIDWITEMLDSHPCMAGRPVADRPRVSRTKAVIASRCGVAEPRKTSPRISIGRPYWRIRWSIGR